jgi:hypothetical protein
MFGINRVSRRARRLPVLPGPRPGAPLAPVAEVPEAFDVARQRDAGLRLGDRQEHRRIGLVAVAVAPDAVAG